MFYKKWRKVKSKMYVLGNWWLQIIANRNATTALYLRKRQNIEILHQVNRKKVDTFGIFDLPLTVKKNPFR